MNYPPRIPLARLPTPLQPLPRLSASHGRGHRLWVKRDDLTGAALSGNKARKLEFVLAAAQEQECQVLITCGGLQSNHCRATALAGAANGFKVHLILRGEPEGEADGNLLLDYLAGAEVSCYPPAQYTRELEALFQQWQEHYAARNERAFLIPTGASDGLGIWGYIAASEELAADLAAAGIEAAHILCATGSGGTQAGLTLGFALQAEAAPAKSAATVWGVNVCDEPIGPKLAPGRAGTATVWGVNVCDDEAWFLNKIQKDIADWQARWGQALPEGGLRPQVIDGYVGPGYGRADREVFEAIVLAARTEGLVLDPVYTGKAFYAMLREIEAGRFAGCRDIVFLHTGGIFGLFPQRGAFGFGRGGG